MEVPKSPFIGINPYLMSFLQTVGTSESPSTFPSFHSDHLTHIKDFLNRVLPPQYIALSEPSIQIQGRGSLDEGFHKDSTVVPDVSIYKPHQGTGGQVSNLPIPTLELDVEIVEEEKEWMSVVIREFRTAEHKKHGAAIVRIELLSPANMMGESYADIYQHNRQKCILSGSKLIEIDYLHEYSSPVPNLPLYPKDAQAQAYNICVAQPETMKVAVYFWGINEPIRPILIPLKGEDSIVFDFTAPYQYTWENSRLWFYLNYQKDPERMNSYRSDDQALIRQITKEMSA
jgi:hypothetical protein